MPDIQVADGDRAPIGIGKGAPQTKQPNAEIRRLLKSTEAGLSITEQIKQEDAHHRRKVSDFIVKAFILINVAILFIVLVIFAVESYILINYNKDYNRIIDSKAIMTLIGATTVQFGAMALAVSSWLFPKNGRS